MWTKARESEKSLDEDLEADFTGFFEGAIVSVVAVCSCGLWFLYFVDVKGFGKGNAGDILSLNNERYQKNEKRRSEI